MKRFLALFLTLLLAVGLCGCGGTSKAFDISKTAYDRISTAYDITSQISSDLYEAWRLGIYDDDEILDDGVSYLASELSLSEDELLDGVAYCLCVEIFGEEWDSISEDEKEEYRQYSDAAFSLMEDSLFSFCVKVVTSAYTVNGKVEEAQTALNEAKALMKTLSADYSDYEHYPNLKEYFTTTSSFFDFCQNPTGSFEQVKETINNYRNEARDYINDLDYIFEE